ncbi:MAG: tRNA-dihydrouridine synthase [Fuerstiella sp.]|nr:tRNA-dihydrouridine synthase [Fuerstiella sp.]
MQPGTLQSVAGLQIGTRHLSTRYFLAPLAGYTHLAFRVMLRRLGGVGLATTDLVQAQMLLSQTRKSLELIATTEEDRPLSVQLFSGRVDDLVKAAKWLQDRDYGGVDINMGCPMARINGAGGGARLMCDTQAAVEMVARVIDAVDIPVTVKMRLGWDEDHPVAPQLAEALEKIGTSAVTVHGRTRQQGFHGGVNRTGIRETVRAVCRMPIIANGDVRSVEDAQSMFADTGCAGIAIGRGAMLDPWIFRRLQQFEQGLPPADPSPDEQVSFLEDHFRLMAEQHAEYSCVLFRKFAAWYGVVLGIPEYLEDRLRRFESYEDFDEIVRLVRRHHGERQCQVPTALIKVPNGPVSHW